MAYIYDTDACTSQDPSVYTHARAGGRVSRRSELVGARGRAHGRAGGNCKRSPKRPRNLLRTYK